MPTLVPRLAALVLGLLGPPGAPAHFPASAEVSGAAIAVFDEPDDRSFSSGRLPEGERLTVRDANGDGWLAIDPPSSSLSWIEQSALEDSMADGRARVRVPSASVRSGRLGARMPGPPRSVLREGAIVRLLDLPPLTLGSGRGAKTWRAIATPAGEVRYVRVEGVRWTGPDAAVATEEVRASYQPRTPSEEALPADVGAALAQIDALHREAVRGPVEGWRLDSVRARCQALLKGIGDAAAGRAVRERLDLIARQEEAAEAAREIATILARSRRRDQDLARIRKRLASAERPERRPYAAEGIVQSSVRKVRGKRVLALIGPEGTAIAYLDVPDGLDASPMLSRRVGVRGDVHFDEQLGARLIAVRAFEPIGFVR